MKNKHSFVHFFSISLAFFLFSSISHAAPGITEDEGIRRIQAHLLIDDPTSALSEAKELYESFAGSLDVGIAYIEALAANGMEEIALKTFSELALKNPSLSENRHVLEELSWGVLKKGVKSSQYGIRLASLIGSYLTKDIRAVQMLVSMMRDSNAIIRSVAVQMATSFGDAPLKDEISRLMREEKIWLVRLEVIRAAGALRMYELESELREILSSDRNTVEERRSAIEALALLNDQVTLDEWTSLYKSNRAGMRQLACLLATQLKMKEAQEGIVQLTKDANPDVRVAALNAIGLVYLPDMEMSVLQEISMRSMKDVYPAVAITAGWVTALFDFESAEPYFEKWLKSSLPEERHFAATVLASASLCCSKYAKRVMHAHFDPYVRANLAIGLIGRRLDPKCCCNILHRFLKNEERKLMWDTKANSLFQVLSLSYVRHIDQIPNYPEAIDQMTRLNLVSFLAILEDARALDLLKVFLKRKSWGITGVAAATLLQEGDESTLDLVRSLVQDSDPEVRLQSCLVLAMLGRDESILSDLQKMYESSEHEYKLNILEALGRIGKEESFQFFLTAMQEPFQILRVAAASGLIQGLNR